jgi:hypothetical protein
MARKMNCDDPTRQIIGGSFGYHPWHPYHPWGWGYHPWHPWYHGGWGFHHWRDPDEDD